MAVLSRRRRSLDFWPGFVDAISALLMVMVFVILIFVIGQFVLTDAVSGRDRALDRLNAELALLVETLTMESKAKASAEAQVGELRASLLDMGEQRDRLVMDLKRSDEARDSLNVQLDQTRSTLAATETDLSEQEDLAARLIADIAVLDQVKAELEAEVAKLAGDLDDTRRGLTDQTEVSDRALAQVETLNRQIAAVRLQLEQLTAALSTAEETIAERDIEIEDLGRQLNLALVSRVRQLERYRSEFFERLSAVLGQRDDIQIVGDRFVFASEVLFDTASDEVSEQGLRQLIRLAETLKALAEQMPADLPWVLQVDGHSDKRPISTPRFPSNWELSAARALAIVKFLHDQGISAERLAATGYGEFQPLDAAETPEAYARNRRIELKLTSR